MASQTPSLFLDDNNAKEAPGKEGAILDDPGVDSQLRAMWSNFQPYADGNFVARMRASARGLRDNQVPGSARSEAYFLFHRCWWEMYVGCALLEQGVQLVPRAQWDNSWKGAGPDLMATIDGLRVWIECVAPGPGDGADAVPELTDGLLDDVPLHQISLRFLSVIEGKRKTWAGYMTKGIVKAQDGFVVAINAHGVPLTFLSGNRPLILNSLYGLGDQAITYNRTTKEWSEPFLKRRLFIPKLKGEAIDANLFGNGKAAEVSGVLYSTVDAWHPKSTPALGVLFVHNLTAAVPLPDRWLPQSVSYAVTVNGARGTIERSDVQAAVAAARL
ncbi:MAG: hypothetical protein ACKVW3_03515 [Phycisphaerales bacterium]